jgi:hypothetical protein
MIAVIDADLRDPPEVIPDDPLAQGFGVVYGFGRNEECSSGWPMQFLPPLSAAHNVDIQVDSGDFALMDRRV